VETSVENLFLDRLALLFARIKTDDRKTPANVTATCLVRHDSRLDVYIAKNDGLQDGNEVSSESEKAFAKKLQDWIREEANSEALFDDDDDDDVSSVDEEDESNESVDGEAEPMFIRMAIFWKDRVNYYVKESKDAWDRMNQRGDAKTNVESYFQMWDEKFTKERFHRDWDRAAKLAHYLRNRPANEAITTKFLVKFYRFWNRSGREDWHKPLESELTEARNFRKCVRYMEMLGTPISTWKACMRFRKLPNYKTVHLIAIDKPIFEESRLDKSSIIKVLKWWKTRNSLINVSLPLANLQRMDIEPELFFHCELQILTLLTLKYPTCGHYFIGCSKLSCESCWQILRNDEQFTTRGSHHKVSANCAFPFPSELETIGRSIRQMQWAWKKTFFSDSIYRSNLPFDDTDQARTRWNTIAEVSCQTHMHAPETNL
jgi:OTT_1508-like deaminase